MTKDTILCNNCVHQNTCSLGEFGATIYCEEHELHAPKLNGHATVPKAASQPVYYATNLHYNGLCGNCELRNHCVWKNDSAIIFSCEHYQ